MLDSLWADASSVLFANDDDYAADDGEDIYAETI